MIGTTAVGGISCDARPSSGIAGALHLHMCVSWATYELARCGTFEVAERRDGPPGDRTIALPVMVLPARNGAPASVPLVFLNGGPGLSTIAYARYASWALDVLRDTHDLLLVDMRGTGGPDALPCNLYKGHGHLAPYIEPMFPLARVRECAARLARHADLGQYTTENAARDLDAVRASLGIDQVDLFGVSYGSRLGLTYMRLFPRHVHRSVLLGVNPPEFPSGIAFAEGTERALDAAFAGCRTDVACRVAVPDPRRDIATLLGRLRATPAELRLRASRLSGPEHITLTAPALAELLWMESYSPRALLRVLPLVHHAVETGDDEPLVRYLGEASESRRSGRSEGLMLSVMCAEDTPRLSASDAHDGETLLGAPVLHDLLAACAVWPRGAISPAFGERLTSDIPTLLISGALDPVTPSYFADSAALGLRRAERYVEPDQGHGVLTDSARARMAFFLSRP
jgi:pimeloyl-ACP methyl ester carboxylesterase